MKILVIDDKHEKVELIAKALEEAKVVADLIHETNGAAARARLVSGHYDLLLVDLNLPSVAGAAPSPKGGLQLFEIIVRDSKSNIPSHYCPVKSRINSTG